MSIEQAILFILMVLSTGAICTFNRRTVAAIFSAALLAGLISWICEFIAYFLGSKASGVSPSSAIVLLPVFAIFSIAASYIICPSVIYLLKLIRMDNLPVMMLSAIVCSITAFSVLTDLNVQRVACSVVVGVVAGYAFSVLSGGGAQRHAIRYDRNNRQR